MLDKQSVMPKKDGDAKRRVVSQGSAEHFVMLFALLLREAVALVEGNADFRGAEDAIEVCLGAR